MDYSKYLSTRAHALHGALGKQTSVPIPGLINLGSGTPDFVPPPFVMEAMQQALRENKVQYTAWTGIPELRAAIAEKLKVENNLHYDPATEILVTSGAQEALMTVMMALCNPDDEVVTPAPHYDEYTRDTRILGAKLVPVETTRETNFTVNVADLAAAITPRTRALIVLTPNNPTGTVLPEATLRGCRKPLCAGSPNWRRNGICWSFPTRFMNTMCSISTGISAWGRSPVCTSAPSPSTASPRASA